MSSDQYPDYFVAQSCLHIVINYLQPPETDQNMSLFVPLSLASAKFRKIPGKHRNSVETGKFRGSARNSMIRGKLWCLLMWDRLTLMSCVWMVCVMMTATLQAETHKLFERLQTDVEKRDADIRQLQRSLKESEGVLVSNIVSVWALNYTFNVG